jgi:rhodanese-related sulfurtransferase
MSRLPEIQAADARKKLESGAAVLIDIRDLDEYAREHILGARLVPLNAIDTHDFDQDHGKIAIFTCQSGRRTQENAATLLGKGFRESYALCGGLSAWRAAGLPVHVNHKQPIPIMRQVQISAGFLVVLGILLAVTVSPWFAALSAFIGAGLMFAGISGTCAMAAILRRMPWNKPLQAS